MLAERDPARASLGRSRRRGGDRVDRPVHRSRGRRQAPRGRGQEGDHLGPRQGARRHRGAGGQLRRGLRPRRPRRHLQRLLHDQLPGSGRQGDPRDGRDRARPDDHDPRLHGRPAPPGHAAQGPAPRPRRGDQPDPDLDRRREGDRPGAARARGQAERARGAGAGADRLGRRPGLRRRQARPRAEEINAAVREAAEGPWRGSSPTPRTRSSPPTSSATRTRRSSTPSRRW